MSEVVQRLEADLARERARASKADRLHTRTREDLAMAEAKLMRAQHA